MQAPDLSRAAQDSLRALAVVAREDFDVFANFVLKDEITGTPISQGWIHEAWTQIRAHTDKCVIISFPEAGKTQQIAAVVLWHLGHNPRVRLAVISRTQGQAIDILKLIATYIETSEELRMVFPNLRPSTAARARWNQTQLDIDRPGGIKEPSVQAFGIDAGAITGKRVDGFLIDDVLDVRTTRTKAARTAVSNKFWREIYNRRSENAWFVVLGNPWHPEDWYCELEKMGWPTFRFPVRVTAELQREWNLQVPIGSPTWPERWSAEKIAKYERDLPRREFERAYMVHVELDGSSPFKQVDIDHAVLQGREIGVYENVDALELAWNLRRFARLTTTDRTREKLLAEATRLAISGEETNLARISHDQIVARADTVRDLLEGQWEDLIMITGVDPSSGTAKDPSAIVTMALARSTNERIIVDIEHGWWEQLELTRRVGEHWNRWDSVVVFETVGMQDWGRQVLQATFPDMRVERLNTTGSRKASASSGLPAFAHRFSRGIVSIANNGVLTDPQRQFCREATSLDMDAHTGDVLMAAWFCDHYAYKFTARKAPSVGVMVFG